MKGAITILQKVLQSTINFRKTGQEAIENPQLMMREGETLNSPSLVADVEKSKLYVAKWLELETELKEAIALLASHGPLTRITNEVNARNTTGN